MCRTTCGHIEHIYRKPKFLDKTVGYTVGNNRYMVLDKDNVAADNLSLGRKNDCSIWSIPSGLRLLIIKKEYWILLVLYECI